MIDGRRLMMASRGGGSSLPFPIDKIDAGTTTIETATDVLPITHTLGAIPDFAIAYADYGGDLNNIPYGCCVYSSMIADRMYNSTITNTYTFLYRYRHGTSGNVLAGQATGYFTTTGKVWTETSAYISRGASNWSPTDANGDTVTYYWLVGTFKR